MGKIKKSITISSPVAEMLSAIANKLEITENAIVSIAITEFYNKIKNSL